MINRSWNTHWALSHSFERIPTIWMGSPIHPQLGNGAKRLVHLSGAATRNHRMGNFNYQLYPYIWIHKQTPNSRCCATGNKGTYLWRDTCCRHRPPSIQHNYTAWYNITKDPRDSDPAAIISMRQKGCTKWKEIARVKIHDTLLERTFKKREKEKERGKMNSFCKKG